jgi:hypothetical protein
VIFQISISIMYFCCFQVPSRTSQMFKVVVLALK